MTKRGQFLVWFLPVAVLYAAGFIVATMWDLPINMAVYHPQNAIAIVWEAFGWLPVFLPAMLYAIIWVSQPNTKQTSVLFKIVGWGVLFGMAGGTYYMMQHYLEKREWIGCYKDWRSMLLLAIWLFIITIVFIKMMKVQGAVREKLRFFAYTGALFLVGEQAIITAMKTIWQRTRFDDMIVSGSFSQFTPWFQPFANGGSSMPSGHTANAAGILLLLVLCDLFPAWNKRKKVVLVLCWLYIGCMAIARIVIGRHFLSDTLAASALVAVSIHFVRSSRWYQKKLCKTKENAATMQ